MGWGIDYGVVWLIVAGVLVAAVLMIGFRKEQRQHTDE